MNISFPQNLIFFQDLILQRTTPFLELGGANALKEWMLNGNKDQLTRYLVDNDLLNVYLEKVTNEIANDVNQLIKFSEINAVDNLVSIGPGNGILELFFYIQKPFKKILLIDIESSLTHQHSFYDEGSGYASLKSTKNFLIANNIPAEKIFICNPKNNSLPSFKFDLLISIISMGFHYPCNDYADFILTNIDKAGSLIFDKRKNVLDIGFQRLSECLKIKNQIESGKRIRVFFKAKSE